jgi:hypothetical protein
MSCARLELFTNVTRDPSATVMFAGETRPSDPIVMVFVAVPPPPPVPPPPGEGDVGVPPPPPPPHAPAVNAAASASPVAAQSALPVMNAFDS